MFNDPFFSVDVPGINALNFDGFGISGTLRGNAPASELARTLAILRNYQDSSGRDVRQPSVSYPDIIDVLPGEDGTPAEDDELTIDIATGKAVPSNGKTPIAKLGESITSKGMIIAGVILLLVGLSLIK